MALLKIIIAFVLLVTSFHHIEGTTNQLPDARYNASWSTEDEYFDRGSGSGGENHKNKPPCCTTGNLSIYSINDALNHISSNNIITNIMSDDVLLFNITLEGLENVTIMGHRNPVVNCSYVGAVKLISCKNMIIKGIRWENCGSIIHPALAFYNSSNVSFDSCSFHNSTILLSEMRGYVHINNCTFTHKIEYRGHGAAIHYLPGTDRHSHHQLIIHKSKFILNRATKSVVYIDSAGGRTPGNVYLQDNVFVNNTGIPVYISNSNLHIEGNVLFNGNTAKSGGGIYSNNSNVTFYGGSNVDFSDNSAAVDGGAIYLTSSTAFFR